MQFARRVHSNTTLKGKVGRGGMEIEYLKKKRNYVQVFQIFLSKIVDLFGRINCRECAHRINLSTLLGAPAGCLCALFRCRVSIRMLPIMVA